MFRASSPESDSETSSTQSESLPGLINTPSTRPEPASQTLPSISYIFSSNLFDPSLPPPVLPAMSVINALLEEKNRQVQILQGGIVHLITFGIALYGKLQYQENKYQQLQGFLANLQIEKERQQQAMAAQIETLQLSNRFMTHLLGSVQQKQRVFDLQCETKDAIIAKLNQDIQQLTQTNTQQATEITLLRQRLIALQPGTTSSQPQFPARQPVQQTENSSKTQNGSPVNQNQSAPSERPIPLSSTPSAQTTILSSASALPTVRPLMWLGPSSLGAQSHTASTSLTQPHSNPAENANSLSTTVSAFKRPHERTSNKDQTKRCRKS